jgi:hypothetical protein
LDRKQKSKRAKFRYEPLWSTPSPRFRASKISKIKKKKLFLQNKLGSKGLYSNCLVLVSQLFQHESVQWSVLSAFQSKNGAKILNLTLFKANENAPGNKTQGTTNVQYSIWIIIHQVLHLNITQRVYNN